MGRTTITELTDEERAQMKPWADQWTERGFVTGEIDVEVFSEAAARCYGFIDVPWHNNVVRVKSPASVSLAAPYAAYIIDDLNFLDAKINLETITFDALRSTVNDTIGHRFSTVVVDAVTTAIVDVLRNLASEENEEDFSKIIEKISIDDAKTRIKSGWLRRFSGAHWAWWPAYTSFFRDVLDLELPGDLWDRDRAWSDAQMAAGWWWPHENFIIVSDHPDYHKLERVSPDGWGSHRLHCEDGPVLAWGEEYATWYWHGREVEQWVVEDPTFERIAEEENVEQRRCAIESLGWDKFTEQLELIDTCEDPGNAPNMIELYSVPTELWGEETNIILVTNGSPERDGTRRRYGLTVPPNIDNALEAASWTYGLTPEQYSEMGQRT